MEPGGLYAEFCNPDESGPVTIYLGPSLPAGSSSLPRDGIGHPTCPSIWPCSGWGLPGALITEGAGALLPHHFTLTARPVAQARGGMFLWHFPSGRPARVLPGTLPGGARTFLPPDESERRPPSPLAPVKCIDAGQRRSIASRRTLVQRLVSQRVSDFVLLARDVFDRDARESGS